MSAAPLFGGELDAPAVVHPEPSFATRLAAAFQVPGNRNAAMEGLRGFSAFIVFGVHWSAFFGDTVSGSPGLRQATWLFGNFGHLGVDIFFALSGYLIYSIAMKGGSYGLFVRRRIQRIYPVFAVVFALYLLAAFTIAPTPRIPPTVGPATAYLVANFFMLPGVLAIIPLISVAWSLSYEFFFYLALPLIAMGLRRQRWSPAARIAVIAAAGIAMTPLHIAGYWPWPRMQMFAVGMILRELEPVARKLGKPSRWAEASCLVAFAVYMALAGRELVHIADYMSRWAGPYGVPLFSVCGGFLCWYGLFRNGIIARMFSWTPLRWFGNMSYSYYLTHGFALHMLRIALTVAGVHVLGLAGSLVLLVVAFSLTVLSSAAVFLWVERPLSIDAATHRSRAVAAGLAAAP